MRIADALRIAEERLRGTADHPAFEAEFLLSVALHTDRAHLLARLQEPLNPAVSAALDRLIQNRNTGTPLSLIRGWKRFRNLTLFVSRGVFIPRYETEMLVEVALQHTHNGTALDLGTGSGALAIALASEGRFSRLIATDISEDALALARRNTLFNNVSNVVFYQGDLYSALPEDHPPFDLIVSNPPYIPTGDIAGLPLSVRDFEPRMALDGGTEGLDIIRRIIEGAPAHMRSGAALVLEIAPFQAPTVASLLESAGFQDVRFFMDGTDTTRCVRALIPPGHG